MKLLEILVPVLLLAAAGFMVAKQVRRDPPRYWSLRSLDRSYLDVQQAMRGEYGTDPENDRLSKPAYRAVVHQMPPAEGDGEYLTPCCGRSPFDLIAGHEPMALRDEQVTCRKAGDES